MQPTGMPATQYPPTQSQPQVQVSQPQQQFQASRDFGHSKMISILIETNMGHHKVSFSTILVAF